MREKKQTTLADEWRSLVESAAYCSPKAEMMIDRLKAAIFNTQSDHGKQKAQSFFKELFGVM